MNKVSWKLKSFLYSFFPKPDKTIYIYNSLNVLHRRKPEHSIEDLKRQERLFRKILAQTKAYPVRNGSVESSIKKITEFVLR